MMAFSLTCCPTSCASGVPFVQKKKKRFIQNKNSRILQKCIQSPCYVELMLRMGMQLCLMKPQSLIARHVEHQPLSTVSLFWGNRLCTHSENLKWQTCGERRLFPFLLVLFKLRRRWKTSEHTGLLSSALTLTFVCLFK